MKPLQRLLEFYRWWIATLLDMLPDTWRESLGRFNKDIEIVIAHQGETLFAQTEKGQILESVSNNADDDFPGVKQQDSVQPDTDRLGADTEITGSDVTNTIAFKTVGNSDTTEVDIDLLGPAEIAAEDDNNVDFYVSVDNAETTGTNISGSGKNHAAGSNVIPLNIPSGEEITVVIDDGDDQTLRLQERDDSDITVNTLVIHNDQGNTIHGGADPTLHREDTLMFINDGGQIRQVNPNEMESLPGSTRVSEDITELVTDFNAQGHSTEYRQVAMLLEKYQRKNKCLYLLPENKFFILNLNYPVEAVLSIETVLRYDLEKHIPLSFDEVRYFYALNVDSATERVKVEVAVIKASEYAELRAALEPFIGDKLVCSTHNFYRKYGAKINFLEDKSANSWKSVTKASNLHSAVNWVLVLVLLLFPLYYFQYRVAQMDRSSPDELVRVKEILSSLHEINAGVKYGKHLVDTVNGSTQTVELLKTLSSEINRQAWINRLTFKDGEVKIRGEAESATQVSDDLARTGLFESIKFVSSIVKNPNSGKETFELQLLLKASDA